ncbi:MAG: thiamine pyrophosphate-dependent enzyme [Bacteroidota bacterium]|nr:thiamine pyrophosphate-dependent enzyme [Bacteroidota bacterium]
MWLKLKSREFWINNSELGKISKQQRSSELEVWQTSLHNPNFADFANNCRALGIRVEKREELELAMRKIKDHKGPALLEVICDVALV